MQSTEAQEGPRHLGNLSGSVCLVHRMLMEEEEMRARQAACHISVRGHRGGR